MYMYNWFTLPYTWNSHNIVNQLYFNKNFLKKNLGLGRLPWTTWVGPITRVLKSVRERQEGGRVRDRLEDAMMLTLIWSNGPWKPRDVGTSRSWKRHQKPPLEPPERRLADTFVLSPQDPFLTSDLQNRKVINLWYFKPVNSWWFVTAALRHSYTLQSLCLLLPSHFLHGYCSLPLELPPGPVKAGGKGLVCTPNLWPRAPGGRWGLTTGMEICWKSCSIGRSRCGQQSPWWWENQPGTTFQVSRRAQRPPPCTEQIGQNYTGSDTVELRPLLGPLPCWAGLRARAWWKLLGEKKTLVLKMVAPVENSMEVP